MFDLDEIYSVSDFVKLCRNSIEQNIPHCWVQGEISNLLNFLELLVNKDTGSFELDLEDEVVSGTLVSSNSD